MHFLPFVIWVIGFCAASDYCAHNRLMDGRPPMSSSAENFETWVFFLGTLFLFLVGCYKTFAKE
jgi:hypothetical protein